MKLKRESVLYAFMRRQKGKTVCVKCGHLMITLDEPEFQADRICTKCGKDLLNFLMKHGGEP